MKKLLILFGVLDILTLIRWFALKTIFVAMASSFGMLLLKAATYLLLASLLFSAYFLIRGSRIGLLITYWQFPFRILLSVYSFSILISIMDLLYLGQIYVPLMWVILCLEVLRLVITIRVHRARYLV
jgi:hypothetical protein